MLCLLCVMSSLAAAGEPAISGDVGLEFSAPEPVLAGAGSTIRLAISPDGDLELWGEVRGAENGGLDIRLRHRSGNRWKDAEDAPFNTGWSEFDPAFAADGTSIYFFSNRPGGEGGDDLWYVPLTDGEWGDAVNVGPPVNTAGNEWAPAPLADSRLLFSSDGHGGFGGQDLFIAERTGDGWSAPQNLGEPANSAADDYDAVFLDADTLVFTRSKDPESGSELFYSCRTQRGFTTPVSAGGNVNLGGGFALGPSVSALHPGLLFFSGGTPDDSHIKIYGVRYERTCRSL